MTVSTPNDIQDIIEDLKNQRDKLMKRENLSEVSGNEELVNLKKKITMTSNLYKK